MYMTQESTETEMRADDGERQLTVSRDTLYSHPPSHTCSLLHSNRLTNVPWKFTLGAGEGKKGGCSWKVVCCRNRVHTFFSSRVVDNIPM